MDLYDMFNSISEQHKVHLLLPIDGVEFLQARFGLFLHSWAVSQFAVNVADRLFLFSIVFPVKGWYKTSKKQWLYFYNLLVVLLKSFLDLSFEHGHEVVSILLRNKTVGEDALELMRPQFDNVFFFR